MENQEQIAATEFPQEIAKAVIKAMGGVTKLARDGRNKHGGYNFASVDAFYDLVRPLIQEAGLFLWVQETDIEVIPSERPDKAGVMRVDYALTLTHESGVCSPTIRRSIHVTAAGPQSSASALSFVTKYFWRNLLQIPTGEADDADLQEATPLPAKAKGGKDQAQEAARKFAQSAIDFVGNAKSLAEIEDFLKTKDKHVEALKRYGEMYAEFETVRALKIKEFSGEIASVKVSAAEPAAEKQDNA